MPACAIFPFLHQEPKMVRQSLPARGLRTDLSILLLGTVILLFLGPGVLLAEGKGAHPKLDTIDKQGKFLILDFEDMSTKVLEICVVKRVIAGHRGPDSQMIHSVRMLNDSLALFQLLTGQWQLWDIQENRFIAELPAMPVVGGLKGFYRISRKRVAFTYYRRNSPMTVVDLQSGKRREISAPAKRWYLTQVQGPLFLSLAKEKLSLFHIDSGYKAATTIESRRFALVSQSRAVIIYPSGPGKMTLGLVSLPDMSVIKRREALLDISDFDTNFWMGCDPSGEILYVAGRDSVSFFELTSLKRIGHIPGINFDFAGKKGLIVHDIYEPRMTGGKPQRSLCIRSLYEEVPRLCLDYASNVSGQFGEFHLEPGLVWADNGNSLRIWGLESGGLEHEHELPKCLRSPNKKGSSLFSGPGQARPKDLVVDETGLAWAACAAEKRVELYRLGQDGPEQVLTKEVPSSFAVFIFKERNALVHVDAWGRIKTWSYKR